MTMRRRFPFTALILVAVLGGCTTSSHETVGSVFVSPGKYVLYTCPELIQRQKEIVARQRELEGLMAKAGKDSAGRFVSVIAYETDYATAKADMKVVRQEGVAKQCQLPDPYATPAPAAPPPAAHAKPARPKR